MGLFMGAGDIPGEIASQASRYLASPSSGEGEESYPTKLKNAANSSAWVDSPSFR